MWHSNSPLAGTGYGNQTNIFTTRLRDLGHDVAISAFYGLHGAPISWDGITLYPGGYHPYGMDMVLGHAADHFGGDVEDGLIITLIDAWVLDAALLTRTNVASWAPVDHEPCPRHVSDFFHSSQATPIAMSRHGAKEFRAAGLEPLYVPHGCNTKMYAPRDEAEAKRSMGISSDAFVVGVVAANKGYPSRKGFPQMIDAFGRFQKKHRDAILYLHTEVQGAIQGVNLVNMCEAFGVPSNAVVQCDQHKYVAGMLTADHMVNAYNAMSVFMNCSYGEGFGIPVLEAQACGTPAVTTNWTAMREIGKPGWQVEGIRQFTDQQAWQMIPDVGEIVAALEQAYADDGSMGVKARKHALKYDADLVTRKYWKPALEQIEQQIFGEQPSVVVIGPTAELEMAA